MNGPRFLYLHGFASGPRSTKGVRLADYFATRNISLERLDLRAPSLERLSFAAMRDVVVRALGGPRDRAVVFGSSLGGLTAARVAEDDARVCALVLLAPAFRLAERWRARMSDADWNAWQTSGWLAIRDYTTNAPARVHFDFIRELATADAGWPDVRVPTLIIHGTADDTVDPQLSRDFARDKPWVHLMEVDDGHELTQSIDCIAQAATEFLAPFGVARPQ